MSETKQINDGKEMSIWEHIDELRSTLIKILIGVVVCMIIVFVNKNFVFENIIFAASNSDFIFYRVLCDLGKIISLNTCVEPFQIKFINTLVSGQFMAHLNISFWLGLILAFPWIVYQLWQFVSPGLYINERKAAKRSMFFGGILFFIGTMVGYFIMFPITLKFFASYLLTDSELIPNQFNISSYINILVTLTMLMGVMFELPAVIYLLSRIGIVDKKFLRKYRRHSVIIILILAAVITPTPDAVIMLAVAAPIYLLYEFSIMICKN